MAARIDSDAIVLVDLRQNTLASAGPLADRWPRGRAVSILPATSDADNYDGVVRMGANTFRVITVPLFVLGDEPIGALYLATSLDRRYAESLDTLSRTRIAIVSDNLLIASTLPDQAAREFESSPGATQPDGTITLNGESFAFRRLVQLGDTSFYALGSIDELSSAAIGDAMTNLALIAIGAGISEGAAIGRGAARAVALCGH